MKYIAKKEITEKSNYSQLEKDKSLYGYYDVKWYLLFLKRETLQPIQGRSGRTHSIENSIEKLNKITSLVKKLLNKKVVFKQGKFTDSEGIERTAKFLLEVVFE